MGSATQMAESVNFSLFCASRDIQGIAGGLMKTKLILLVLATVGVCMSQTNVV
jgi:hypothetical protein